MIPREVQDRLNEGRRLRAVGFNAQVERAVELLHTASFDDISQRTGLTRPQVEQIERLHHYHKAESADIWIDGEGAIGTNLPRVRRD